MISFAKFLKWADTESGAHGPAALVPAEIPADLSVALREALRLLLEGVPLRGGPGNQQDGKRQQTLAGLLRRLEGPLEPFDAIEIATAALALFEQDAFQEGERRQEAVVEPNTQAELARALIEALKTLLAGWPLDGDARPVMEGLLRRLNAPLEPFDALEIAGEALGAIEQNARESKERLRQSEDQRRAADQQAELAGASVRALQMVLEGAPCSSEADGPAEPRAKRVLVELRRRCEGPLQAADVIGIAREAVTVMQEQAAVQRRVQPDPPPAEQPPQTLAKPDALSQALLQALQMLLGNWPFPGGSGRETERPGRKRIEKLLHRLEGPLVPFDVVEIASDALAVFEEDAKAAAAAGKEDRGRDTTAIDLSEALLESLRLLLGGLPGGNEAAGRPEPEARRIIGGLLERLERPLVPFDILEIANEALAALALNGKATLERHRLHSEELQAMISMLTETVAALSVQSTASVTRLQQIERKIEQASMVEDLRSLKANLAECLDAVREASVHQQKQTAETIQLFERQIQTAKSRMPLAQAAEADEAGRVEPKPESKTTEYMVVFLLDRENSIAARFGEDARQSILRFVNQRLKDALMPSDRVVRWKGAAFLASLKRTGSILDVRAELCSAATIQVPPFVEFGTGRFACRYR